MRWSLYLLTLLGTIGGTVLAWWTNLQSLEGIDDAHIYFAYMQNLAEGNGFSFNEGFTHVEGFSSLLWTLIGSVSMIFGSSFKIALIIFNILIVSIGLHQLLSALFGNRSNKEQVAIVLFIHAMLFIQPGFYDWTILSLMETGLWSGLLMLTAAKLIELLKHPERPHLRRQFNFFIVLLLICRPESMLIVPLLLLFLFYYARKIGRQQGNQLLKVAMRTLIIFGFAIVLLFAWRLSYFGQAFPNTYYAKVSTAWWQNIVEGFFYVVESLISAPIAIACVLIWIFPLRLPKHKPVLRCIQFITIIGLFLPILTGGDHFGYWRFFQGFAPILYASAMFVIYHSFKEQSNGVAALLALALTLVITNGLERFDNIRMRSSQISYEWNIPQVGKQFAFDLNEFFSEEAIKPSVGTHIVGAVNFYYDGVTIDLLGLNNPKMALADRSNNSSKIKNHSAFETSVFLEQRPDLFISDLRIGTEINSREFIIHEKHRDMFQNIYVDAKFLKSYKLVELRRKGSKLKMITFASVNYLNNLNGQKFKIKEIDFE